MARYSSMSQLVQVLKREIDKDVQKVIVATAKAEHRNVMTDEPRPTSFTRIVDGMEGALEETVKADGRIVYQYSRIAEVVQFAMETLFDLSPVLSGDYRNAHTLIINGQPVASMAGYEVGDEVAITNTVPYARKIEVGRMTMRVAGTSRVYQQARRKVMARYGNMVSVEFTYRAVMAGRVVDQAKTAAKGRPGRAATPGSFEATLKAGAHNEGNVRFPCLVIRER